MIEREQIEMDVVFVGAGPANLAAALHPKKEIAVHDEMIDKGLKFGNKVGELEIAIVEKGSFVGAHILSGAVMDPKAIRELMPDFLDQGCPVDSVVTEDAFWYLTEKKGINAPLVPPPLKNKGKYIVSLSKVCEWLGEKCEEAGINIFPEFPAAEILYDENDAVIGVRTGDKGIDKDGKQKPNFEAGVDLIAKVTVLGEGSRGSLAKQITARLGLDHGKESQVFSLGIKELWELPTGKFPEGKVVHTLGFPSDTRTYGGGWIYGMKDNVVSIGYVTGLDYEDPMIDPHAEFQKFKTHPKVAEVSWIYDELHPVRNFHGAFQKGRWSALFNTGLQFLTNGLAWGFMPKEHHVAGHERMQKRSDGKSGLGPSDHLKQARYSNVPFDKELTFDKVTDVFYGAVAHNEDQPSHLHVLDTEICATRCTEEYGNPCQRFCPAAVYEMEENAESGRRELKVNFSNCVHCKTCDIADPYQIINWVTPEGGGGPNYKGM
ncbi:MAG: electron transfer flavoprotein-ubiquinone oxidoreductase [Acidobacteria bacterium]|nr:electron transfer flavoprotein-ubiquinone oxidoreductase [Acidobacteriota bacterium]